MNSRQHIGRLLAERLRPHERELGREFREAGTIQSFIVDDVLPAEVALQLAKQFPDVPDLMRRSSLREAKYVSSQMSKHHASLEEAIFAFQEEEFLGTLGRITGIGDLTADPYLYASGLSLMCQGDFLNPHLDNSHDKDRSRYRVLNVLYYVSPDWSVDCGGSLELWNEGPGGSARTLPSRFNRLVCMATHRRSWHSVSAVRVPRGRTCISNYYFSARPLDGEDNFRVTTFRGRPEQPLRDLWLRADGFARLTLRKLFPKGIVAPKHVYRKKDAE